MKNQQAIKEAVEVLITEGRKSFRDDCNVGASECIGMALSGEDIDILKVAETVLEDWNYHTEAKALREIK